MGQRGAGVEVEAGATEVSLFDCEANSNLGAGGFVIGGANCIVGNCIAYDNINLGAYGFGDPSSSTSNLFYNNKAGGNDTDYDATIGAAGARGPVASGGAINSTEFTFANAAGLS